MKVTNAIALYPVVALGVACTPIKCINWILTVPRHSAFSESARVLFVAVLSAIILVLCFGPSYFLRPKVEPYQLKNKTPFSQVWISEDENAAHISLVLVYPYGERANPYELGLAHYVEHLAWHNVRSESGNQGRHSNAWTSATSTGYLMSVDVDALSNGIERLMATAQPLQISPEDAVQERDIVVRECDFRVSENPFNDMRDEMVNELYGASGYARSEIGTRESIASFTFEGAQQLHRSSHKLSQAKLLISGPVDRNLVQDILEQLPQQPDLEPSIDLTVAHTTMVPSADIKSITIVGAAERQLIVRSVVSVPESMNPLMLEALINATNPMMLSTKHSGLTKSLRFDEFWARSIRFALFQSGPSVLEIFTSAVPDSKVGLNALKAEFEKTMANARTNATQTDFESIKSRLLNKVDSDIHVLQTNEKRLRFALFTGGTYSSLGSYRKALKSMTFEMYTDFQTHLDTAPRTSTRMILPSN